MSHYEKKVPHAATIVASKDLKTSNNAALYSSLPNIGSKSTQMGASALSTSAYEEFTRNCSALHIKVNTTLLQCAEAIQTGSCVNFSTSYIGSGGLQAMTPLLSKNQNLSQLILARNGINNDAVVFFARSMRNHPRLSEIDFSDNPEISLPGGTALLSLVQQNKRIVSLKLENSKIPDPLLTKIRRALSTNQNAPGDKGSRPLMGIRKEEREEILKEMAAPDRATRAELQKKRWSDNEFETLRILELKLREVSENSESLSRCKVPPRCPMTGWCVLYVTILAPPYIFESEIQIILDEVFPQLNAELLEQGKKVTLIPIVTPSQAPAGTYLKYVPLNPICDTLENIRQSPLMLVELVGDRPGEYEMTPAIVDRALQEQKSTLPTSSTDPSVLGPLSVDDTLSLNLRPILYTAHERALSDVTWFVMAIRKDTKTIPGFSPALAPLLTQEPTIEHPDKFSTKVMRATQLEEVKPFSSNGTRTLNSTKSKLALIKETLEANAITTTTMGNTLPKAYTAPVNLLFNSQLQNLLWNAHMRYRDSCLETASTPELIIPSYTATFEEIAADGQIKFSDLTNFKTALYQRLSLILELMFPHRARFDPMIGFTGALYALKSAAQREMLDKFLHFFVKTTAEKGIMAKKNIINRADLYIMTPPSRNSLIIHSPEPELLTAVVCSCAQRFFAKPYAFATAVHSTKGAGVTEEPTDLHEVILHIVSQLTDDERILRYMRTEIDIVKLRQFFVRFIAAQSGGGAPSTASSVGEDSATSPSLTHVEDHNPEKILIILLDGIDEIDPIVSPCSELRKIDESSVELWADGEGYDDSSSTVNLSFIPRFLSRRVRFIGTCITEGEGYRELEGRGRDCVELLSAGACSSHDVEFTLSPDVVIKEGIELSDDDFMDARSKGDARNPEFLRYLVDALRHLQEEPRPISQSTVIKEFPDTVHEAAYRVYSQIVEKFTLPLVKKAVGILTVARWGLPEPIFNQTLNLTPQKYTSLLRYLRPTLVDSSKLVPEVESGNALFRMLRFSSKAFERVFLQEMLGSGGMTEDIAAWHRILAHFMLDIIRRCFTAESRAFFTTDIAHPFERYAVKELPYHLGCGGMWQTFDEVVLSAPFISLVYRNGLGYHYLRELVRAFNKRHETVILGETSEYFLEKTLSKDSDHDDSFPRNSATMVSSGNYTTDTAGPKKMPATLLRLKEYIYLIRANHARLTEHPELVIQIFLERPSPILASCYASADVRRYLGYYYKNTELEKARDSHLIFIVTNHGIKNRFHLAPTTAVKFSPNGLKVTTGSEDRSLMWIQPGNGQRGPQSHQSNSAIRSIYMTKTNSYVAAIAEKRSIYIYDNERGRRVSKNEGNNIYSPISTFSFSARGRYYFLALEDVSVCVYDTETGELLIRLTTPLLTSWQENDKGIPNEEQLRELHYQRNTVGVLPDLDDDEIFITYVNSSIRIWRIVPTKDRAEVLESHHSPFKIHRANLFYRARPSQACNTIDNITNTSTADDETYLSRDNADYFLLTFPSSSSEESGPVAALYHIQTPYGIATATNEELASNTFTCSITELARLSLDMTKYPSATESTECPTCPRYTAKISFDGKYAAIKLSISTIGIFEIPPLHSLIKSDGRISTLLPRVLLDPFTPYTNSYIQDFDLVWFPSPASSPEHFTINAAENFLSLLVFGNKRQIKLWNLAGNAGLLQNDAANSRLGVCRILPDGEYVSDVDISCIDVLKQIKRKNYTDHFPQVAIGDATGRVLLLRISDPRVLT